MLWDAAAAAVGLAAALRSRAAIYDAFRAVCVVYLLHLAVQAFRASSPPGAAGPAATAPGGLRLGAGFRRALATCLLNPKLGVSFVVFLPLFIPSGAHAATASLILASVQAAEAVIWYVGLAYVAAPGLRGY